MTIESVSRLWRAGDFPSWTEQLARHGWSAAGQLPHNHPPTANWLYVSHRRGQSIQRRVPCLKSEGINVGHTAVLVEFNSRNVTVEPMASFYRLSDGLRAYE